MGSKSSSHPQLEPVWDQARRAVTFLESLGFDVKLTPRDPQALAQWETVEPASAEPPPLDKDAAVALGLLEDKPQPVQVRVALSDDVLRGGSGPGKAPFFEIVARFMAANWSKDWDRSEIWAQIKDVMATRNKNPPAEIAKAMARLHEIGFLNCISKGMGNKKGRFQLNKAYNPDHPRLKFLKEECPNGFRDLYPGYQDEPSS